MFEGLHDCIKPASSGAYWNLSGQIYPSSYILWNETQFPKIIKHEWKWILSRKYNAVNLLHNSFIYFFLMNRPFSLHMYTPNKNFCRSQDVGISADNLQLYKTSYGVMRTKHCNPLTSWSMPRKMSTEMHVVNILTNRDIKIL